MKGRILLLAGMTLAGLLPAGGQSPSLSASAPVIPTTAASKNSRVTCTSADPLAAVDTLQLADDTREQLASLLQLGREWRFAVHIHILTAGDPLTEKINREAAAVFSQGSTMRIEAVVPVADPDAPTFIQRQFVTALLWEKFFAKTTMFDKDTHLDVVPLWLVEGLREWLNEDPEHNRESIVRRAVQNHSAPSLEQVADWHELSDDRLLGLWQRAFCFYLVDSLVHESARRDDFQQWLSGFSEANPRQAACHFPTEQAWQRELADASSRNNSLVYSWAETLAELKSKETITFAASKDARVQTCTLDTSPTMPQSPGLVKALQERIFVLTELELRAHPSWNSVLELYRSALTALAEDNHSEKAKKMLREAQRQRQAELDRHQKMLDYANWFEVTKDYADGATHFESYFRTAQEMERIQADPAHPNPLRANLIQIESEL